MECPKCNSSFQPRQEIQDSGTFELCLDCNTKLWVQKESFILRAYKKDGSLYCVKCREILGISHICKKCGELFPDYYLLQLTRPKIRKCKREKIKFKVRAVRRKRNVESEIIQKNDISIKPEGKSLNKIFLFLIGIISVLVLIGGWFMYDHYKIQRIYMNNFVMALYGMKAGADRCLDVCVQEQQDVLYKLSTQEISTSKKIREDVDVFLVKLQVPPDKFIEAGRHLAELNKAYNEIYSYSLDFSGTLFSYCEEGRRLEEVFQKTAMDLKKSMPEGLGEAVATAAQKYRKLKFIVD